MTAHAATRRRLIAALILLTSIRFMVVSFIPSLEMFGGPNPDAWIGPWGADTVLGALAPLMAWLAWKGTGLRVWGLLIAYNAVGAFDYSHGLLTQWLEPTVTQSAALTYGSIGISFIVQLAVLRMLFRGSVASSFFQTVDAKAGAQIKHERSSETEHMGRIAIN
ncbi:MAG: hypothetical protein AAF689_16255 [Pseudomonadota bacterium]